VHVLNWLLMSIQLKALLFLLD